MKALFVDTSGWMAMADGADPQHEACCAARDDCLKGGDALVSTDYVLDETLTLLRMRLGLRVAASWWRMVERSRSLRWEWIDPGRAERARAWFFRWQDKDFSFTDCTSFVLMKELRLRRALTTDRHFEQAGFETLP
jgi:hypothetical protein